jgi:hypothetical protein
MTEIAHVGINKSKEISYTSEELNEWVKAKLIPTDLLQPSREVDLVNYIIKNKETLHKHYRRNPNDDNYLITMPPVEEMVNHPDLQVIDRRTGKVVKILEMAAQYELCEDVILKVKAKELKDWEKETGNARSLTKEQKKDLKTFLEKKGKDRPLSREEIVTLLEEIRKPKKAPKTRHSGHLVDQKLAYNKPGKKQLEFSDILEDDIKEEITRVGIKFETLVKGIKFTPSEEKLMNSLMNLLREKSESQDQMSKDFYTGNAQSALIQHGIPIQGQERKPSCIRIKPHELYKEYTGVSDYSGKEIANIKSLLTGLQEKKFLIIYDKIKKVTNKEGKIENRTDRIEDFQSMIKVLLYIEDMTDGEKKKLNAGDQSIKEMKGELIVAFNPIITDQIDSKYIEYPADINQRTMIASGGSRHVTESINILRDYMLRELSNKRYHPTINADALVELLQLGKLVKARRKKIVAEKIQGAFNAVKNLGLVSEVNEVIGASGQLKYVFSLNNNFE